MKILVADDDAATRDLVSRALSIDGHEVQVAADGVEALSILKDVDGLDLLISDISMPGMDGHALAAGAITGIPNLRVILMSALDVELDRANATSGANVSTLSKPFSLDDLRALVGKG